MSTAKVYSYRRFSDISQKKGASAARQDAFAQQWAAKHGIELDDELSMLDEGLSAYHQKHVSKGALGVFLRAAEDGKIARGSILIVESLDRLSRAEVLDALAQLTLIINAGISVVTASDEKVYSRESLKQNPMDLMQSLLIMWRAHEESATKSKRVRDAIRRQCLGWQAGTYRGLIRVGNTPAWLRAVDGQWHLIEERAAAVRMAVDQYLQGHGTKQILHTLHEKGLAISATPTSTGYLLRMFANPNLIGEKHLDIDGEAFELAGYYPPVLDAATWRELQTVRASRSNGAQGVRGSIPSVLTGSRLTVCGYCGSPMKAQTMTTRKNADGTLPDSMRRLQCSRAQIVPSCPVKGSCSAAPIERAIVRYCSHMVNLRALYTGDQAALPRAELASAQEKLARVAAQLERLTDAMLSDNAAAPATFIARARALEEEQLQLAEKVRAAELAISQAARADLAGADERWRSLAEGVERLDYAARTKARQLIADTFETIVVWHSGHRPAEAPRGAIDVQLRAKGGGSRLLRIQASGDWVAGQEITAP